jgi:cation transport regulator
MTMPYPKKSDLPDAVKNALPSEAQEIWRNAFNSAYEKYPDDEERCNKIAWGAVKNAGWVKEDDKWVKHSAEPKTHEFDAEIFSVGTWNGDKYTTKDLDAMVEAFPALAQEIKPPVKLGHNEQQMATVMKDGHPALGWVKAVKRQGDKLIATLTGVPEIVYNAITAGRYKRVSAEIYWNLKAAGKTFKRALAGVALLGADIPAVTNLADLDAYLGQSIHDGSFERVGVYSFAVDDSGTILLQEEPDMADDAKKEYEVKLKEMETALKATEEEKTKYMKDLEELKGKVTAEKKEQRETAIKEFCEKAVKEGRMLPFERDAIIAFDKHSYTDEGGYAITFDALKESIEKREKVIPLNEEKGKHKTDTKEYDSPVKELDARARKYMAEHEKVDYGQAMQAVMAEDEELAKEYLGMTNKVNDDESEE